MIKKIRDDIKKAMMEKNVIRRDVLKMVLNKANAAAKENKSIDINDNIVIDAISQERKQIQQTIDILKQNGKEDSDLYKESMEKINILAEYLPMLSEEELSAKIKDFILVNNLDVSNKGLLMKTIMPVFKSKADGKTINKIINSLT